MEVYLSQGSIKTLLSLVRKLLHLMRNKLNHQKKLEKVDLRVLKSKSANQSQDQSVKMLQMI
jgi:hypothetical protein